MSIQGPHDPIASQSPEPFEKKTFTDSDLGLEARTWSLFGRAHGYTVKDSSKVYSLSKEQLQSLLRQAKLDHLQLPIVVANLSDQNSQEISKELLAKLKNPDREWMRKVATEQVLLYATALSKKRETILSKQLPAKLESSLIKELSSAHREFSEISKKIYLSDDTESISRLCQEAHALISKHTRPSDTLHAHIDSINKNIRQVIKEENSPEKSTKSANLYCDLQVLIHALDQVKDPSFLSDDSIMEAKERIQSYAQTLLRVAESDRKLHLPLSMMKGSELLPSKFSSAVKEFPSEVRENLQAIFLSMKEPHAIINTFFRQGLAENRFNGNQLNLYDLKSPLSQDLLLQAKAAIAASQTGITADKILQYMLQRSTDSESGRLSPEEEEKLNPILDRLDLTSATERDRLKSSIESLPPQTDRQWTSEEADQIIKHFLDGTSLPEEISLSEEQKALIKETINAFHLQVLGRHQEAGPFTTALIAEEMAFFIKEKKGCSLEESRQIARQELMPLMCKEFSPVAQVAFCWASDYKGSIGWSAQLNGFNISVDGDSIQISGETEPGGAANIFPPSGNPESLQRVGIQADFSLKRTEREGNTFYEGSIKTKFS